MIVRFYLKSGRVVDTVADAGFTMDLLSKHLEAAFAGPYISLDERWAISNADIEAVELVPDQPGASSILKLEDTGS